MSLGRRVRDARARIGLGPDFGKLWAGQSVSTFGTLVGRFAISLVAVVTLSATPMELALLRAAELVPVIAIGFFAGEMIDRVSRRATMIWADVGRSLVVLAVPALAIHGYLTIGWLSIVVALTAMLGLVFDVAYRAYLPVIVDRSRLTAANARLETTNAIGEVAGFGVAGLLVQAVTAPIAIVVDSISFLVSAISVATIRHRERRLDVLRTTTASVGGWTDGARWVLRVRALRALAGLEVSQNLLRGGAYSTLIMLFFVNDIGMAPALMGVVFSLGGLSAVVGASMTGWLTARYGEARVLIGGYLVGALVTFLVPLASGPWWQVIVMLSTPQLLGDGAIIAYEIAQTSAIQRMTPDRVLGRVLAFYRVAGQVSFLGGTALAVLAADLLGVRGALLAASAGGLMSAVWLIGWRGQDAVGPA